MSEAGAPSPLDVCDEEFDARLDCVNSGLSCDDAIQLVACLVEQTMFKPGVASLPRLRKIQRAADRLVPRLRAEEKTSDWQLKVLCAPVESQCRRTALHICAVYNLAAHAQVLLDMGWSGNERDVRSWTALRCAQVHDSADVVRVLMTSRRSGDDDAESRLCVEEVASLRAMATVPTPQDTPWLSLMHAIVHGNSDTAAEIIDGHASRWNAMPTIHHPRLVLDFIDGEMISEQEILGQSDVMTGQSDVMTGQTPLYLAALLGRHDIVRHLLGVGVSYLKPSQQVRNLRLTALTAAMCRRDADMTGVLLPRVRLSDLVHSFLHGVFARDGDTTCLRLLLSEKRLQPCSEHALAEAALFTACSVGSVDVVRELLAAGVNVNSNKWSLDGETPLMRAAYHGHVDLVTFLLSVPHITLLGRCQPFIVNDTLLHRAVRGGNLVCLKRILRRYPGPTDETNLDGLQPLSLAAKHNQKHSTMLLLRLCSTMRHPFHSSSSTNDDVIAEDDVIVDASLAAHVAAERAHPLLRNAILAELVFPLAWWSATAVARQLWSVHGDGVGNAADYLPLPGAMKDLVLDSLACGY